MASPSLEPRANPSPGPRAEPGTDPKLELVQSLGHPERGGLDAGLLAQLNQRRNGPGQRQLALHLGVLLVGGLLWSLPQRGGMLAGLVVPAALVGPLGVVGLVLLGSGLAFAFCAMHECGHRTAFASRDLNDAVAWWAGVLSFYNADFYRRYHQWHHRYTHLPGLDPELEDSPPHHPGGVPARAECHPLVDRQDPRPQRGAAR